MGERLIDVVPAMKALHLRYVGCWRELDLDFAPGLNIITVEDSGYGSTTIFNAIRTALMPTWSFGGRFEDRLRKTYSSEGRISVELMGPTVSLDIASFDQLTDEPKKHNCEGWLAFLQEYLAAASVAGCLLIESTLSGVLDDLYFREAVKLLNAARGQVLCLIPHRVRLEEFHDVFPTARVFAIRMIRPEGREEPAMITLQQ